MEVLESELIEGTFFKSFQEVSTWKGENFYFIIDEAQTLYYQKFMPLFDTIKFCNENSNKFCMSLECMGFNYSAWLPSQIGTILWKLLMTSSNFLILISSSWILSSSAPGVMVILTGFIDPGDDSIDGTCGNSSRPPSSCSSPAGG